MFIGRFICAALILASFGPIIRYLDDYFSVIGQISLRVLTAFLFAMMMQVFQKKPQAVGGWKISPAWTIVYSTAFPVSVAGFTAAVTMTTIALSVLALYAASIATTTVFSILKKDQSKQWPTAVLSIAGLLIVAIPEITLPDRSPNSVLGITLALSAGVFDGLANQARRRLASAPVNELLIYQFGVGLFIALFALLLVEIEPVRSWSSSSLLVALGSGVLVYGVGAIVHGGYRHFSSRVGTQILALEIPFAMVLAWVFLGEDLTLNTLLGGGLVFAGAALAKKNVSAK